MADRTIDIIYRFLADTSQFNKDLNKAVESNVGALEHLKPPDFSQLERQLAAGGKELGAVTREITRLEKTGQLSAAQAKELKQQVAGAKKEMAELARIHAGYVAEIQQHKATRASYETTRGKQQDPGGFAAGSPEEMEQYLDAVNRRFTETKKKTVDNLNNMKMNANQAMGAFSKFGEEFVRGMHRGGMATDVATRKVKQLNVEAKKGRATLEEIGRAVMVKGFSFYGLRMTGASIAQQGQMASMIGGAISGGMFKMASDYIKSLESATPISREWAEQMERVEGSQKRIGAVMASESLPLLTKGAELLGKLASYIEKNPEAAGRLMRGGLALASVGALVIALGKGITLVSDVAFIAATVNMLKGGRDSIIAAGQMRMSGKDHLKAAGTMALTFSKYNPLNKLAPVPLPKGGVPGTAAGIGVMGQLGLVVAAFTAGVVVLDKVMDKIQGHDVKFGDYVNIFKQQIAINAKTLGDFFGKADPLFKKLFNVPDDLGNQWFKKVRDALWNTEDASNAAAAGLEGISDILANSLKRDEVLAAWENYQADDLALVRKHAADRLKVEQDALESIRKANDKFAADMRKIASKLAEQLADATRDYNKQEEEANRDYLEERKKIIQDGGEELAKIEEDLQEKLRKLEMDHNNRRADLLAARDAVGLVKERKRYLQERSEAEREKNKEIAERRQDIAERLQELQVQHENERAERLAEYKARLEEIHENARVEMEELRKQHAEELREIQINRNNRLRELDIQLTEERNRRRDAFLQQVRDLDATLLGEENLRKQYQERMLKDLDNFLARYRAGQNNLNQAVSGSRQFGGYVAQGLYKLHNGEYVINPNTTRTLEQLMGGQLTQAGLIQMAHNNRTQVTWNDQRRFDSSLRPADRRMIRNDTLDVIEKVVAR